MDIAEKVRYARWWAGLSATQLARTAGVATSTVTRIESGQLDPTVSVATRLLEATGRSLLVDAKTVDMSIVAAARLATNPRLALRPVTEGVRTWLDRWSRIGLVDDDGAVVPGKEADLLFRAGRMARITDRPGKVDFRPTLDADGLVDGMARSGLAWALTGDRAANMLAYSAGECWPVAYVEDVDDAAHALGLQRRPAGEYGNYVSLIAFDGVSEAEPIQVEGVPLASSDQVVLDCYGGIGRMREQADYLMGKRDWT